MVEFTNFSACKTCAANLITVATAGNGAKPMDGDVTVTTGACAVRTFTCIGTSPTIVVRIYIFFSIILI